MMRKALFALLCVAVCMGAAESGEKKRIGVAIASLSNPAFVAMVEGIEAAVKNLGPGSEVTVVPGDFDLSKQSQQIDDFVSAGMDIIILNAVDVEGIAPAVRRIREAGITVVAMDTGADGGVDATVVSNNLMAGELAGEYLAECLGGKGNVVIMNGPPTNAIKDRVSGARDAFAKYPGIKLLSDNQNGLANRDESYRIMGDLLTAFPEIDAVFGCNDPSALGCELAIKQTGRDDILIAGVDGAPDAVELIKTPGSMFVASSAQQIRNLGYVAMAVAFGLQEGKTPASEPIYIPVALLNRDNVASWPDWGPVGLDIIGIELWKK